MKDIISKINESKDSPLYLKTLALIDALKDWVDYGISQDANNSDSPYIKKFKKDIEDFIKNAIINMDYTDGIVDKLIKACNIKVDSEDDWSKIQDAFVNYITKK